MRFEIKDRKRLIFTIIFCVVLVITHVLWRTVIDTGMENKEYQSRKSKNENIGILAEIKDYVWETAIGEKPDRTNTDSRYISIFGFDLSKNFEPICKSTLKFVTPVCNILKPGFKGYEKRTKDGNRYILENDRYKNASFEIVWGCTSIKQIIMFFFIMITTIGKMHHKMLYFLVSIPVISIFNILRISAITCLSVNDMNNFDFWHDGIFRYIFYIFLFGLWLLWAEFITKKLYKQ